MKLKIEDIIPYTNNAKKHPKKQIEQVAESIKEFGFNQPIVIDKNNIVIVGHGRLEAAKLLGLETVPVLQVDLNEEQSKAYRLADNKLNESDWDMDLAIEELKELSEEMFDLTGFDKDLLGAIFSPVGIEDQGRLDEKEKNKCPDCGYEW
jgi:ParB/RepB/Spo0J family partition protein